ncbi:histone promoter control 2 [Metschnikowia bicuspidata var. bicuspidata NRRL YB-4993]|uniref:Histone promoter control 2 n=1 Tax=Metschnikowia bicuspidata var. bicuspidata NRRL YB-4993 TaxID=869754 RepID=A0A1A0HFR3_9ASCO|nr:histone promoter control 2 [Metschnikowia bicuspidata var. bicuspidata NRRL YB-4993]OBA22841.1 histone promoter control 2 [Metschnikowia bicuspidata var. bicuspidata NRRL YB-4993]
MANRATPNEVSDPLPGPADFKHTSANISNLVSQYQTTIGIQSLLGLTALSPTSHEETPVSTPYPQTEPAGFNETGPHPPLEGPSETVLKNTKPPERAIDLNTMQDTRASAGKQNTATKQAKFSRTSISSLINLDESGSAPNEGPKGSGQQEKRKRASPKNELAAKKSKTETTKKSAKTDAKSETKKELNAELKTDPKREAKTDTKRDNKTDTKRLSKEEAKKAPKPKKKTPEVGLPSHEKPSIHPRMTTEKSKSTTSAVSVPAPSFMAINDAAHGDAGAGGPTDEEDKSQLPIIALDIPLLDPKHPQPGQAEVVVNVLKLAEEKYGWSAVHPEARSAFELMDDLLEDDDDGEEEEDEEVMIVDENGNSLKRKDEGLDKKKKKQQVQQQQQSKVNRKVGKYDYEDPFIDDAELQWEEEITTTKEGFFVFWGPLVDERQLAKKGNGKSKK